MIAKVFIICAASLIVLQAQPWGGDDPAYLQEAYCNAAKYGQGPLAGSSICGQSGLLVGRGVSEPGASQVPQASVPNVITGVPPAPAPAPVASQQNFYNPPAQFQPNYYQPPVTVAQPPAPPPAPVLQPAPVAPVVQQPIVQQPTFTQRAPIVQQPFFSQPQYQPQFPSTFQPQFQPQFPPQYQPPVTFTQPAPVIPSAITVPRPAPTPAPPTPAPTPVGTCSNKCGQKDHAANCWCDQQCLNRGDCCPDFMSACPFVRASN